MHPKRKFWTAEQPLRTTVFSKHFSPHLSTLPLTPGEDSEEWINEVRGGWWTLFIEVGKRGVMGRRERAKNRFCLFPNPVLTRRFHPPSTSLSPESHEILAITALHPRSSLLPPPCNKPLPQHVNLHPHYFPSLCGRKFNNTPVCTSHFSSLNLPHPSFAVESIQSRWNNSTNSFARLFGTMLRKCSRNFVI